MTQKTRSPLPAFASTIAPALAIVACVFVASWSYRGTAAPAALEKLPTAKDLEKGAKVRAQSHAVTEELAASVAVGATREWKQDWEQTCNLSGAEGALAAQKETAEYTLTRQDSNAGDIGKARIAGAVPTRFKVQAEIILNPFKMTGRMRSPGQPELVQLSLPAKQAILKTTVECMPVINHYWNAYGIELDLDFRLKKGGEADTHNTIFVLKGQGRSNSKVFYTDGLDQEYDTGQIKIPAGMAAQFARVCGLGKGASATPAQIKECAEAGRQIEYCTTALHEFGHRLGLADEYAEPASCPDRPGISREKAPWSIMAVPVVSAVDSWALEYFLKKTAKVDLAPLRDALRAMQAGAANPGGSIDQGGNARASGSPASGTLPSQFPLEALTQLGVPSELLKTVQAAIEKTPFEPWLSRSLDAGMAEFYPRHIHRVLQPLAAQDKQDQTEDRADENGKGAKRSGESSDPTGDSDDSDGAQPTQNGARPLGLATDSGDRSLTPGEQSPQRER